MQDFPELLSLGESYHREGMTFSETRARDIYQRAVSDSRCYAYGEFDDGAMTGAVVIHGQDNAWYEKQHCSLTLWIGSLKLLLGGIDWAMSRPAVRMFLIIFDRVPQRQGVYKVLERRGFENRLGVWELWK